MKPSYRLIVVLVRSLYDSNIGASSRAMANMGTDEMILINPQCAITYAAQQAAATGQKALQLRRTYASWEEFFKREPDGLRLALTARDGQGRLVENLDQTLLQISADSAPERTGAEPVYLIFGPEDVGLSAEDLELAHHAVSLPTYGQNPSLNLAQAVLLALFIVRNRWGGEIFNYVERGPETSEQSREDLFPEKALREFLRAMGFTIESKRTNIYTVLRRLLLRGRPNVKERRIIFQQGARKMKTPDVNRGSADDI